MALRLTLRTLLAYLDDTLEPTRAKEIGQKIAESPQAQELIDRIRTVMRRRRLIANAADPDATDVDANDVAEYVDNMLDAERVAAFEQSCLESDMNLAEVASVHQILTLVLGKPAEVSAEGRRRIYGFVEGAADQPAKRRPIGPKGATPVPTPSKVVPGESTSILLPIPPFESTNPARRFLSIFAVVSLSVALLVLIWLMLLPATAKQTPDVAKISPAVKEPTPKIEQTPAVAGSADNAVDEPPKGPSATPEISKDPATSKTADAVSPPMSPPASAPAPETTPGNAEEPKPETNARPHSPPAPPVAMDPTKPGTTDLANSPSARDLVPAVPIPEPRPSEPEKVTPTETPAGTPPAVEVATRGKAEVRPAGNRPPSNPLDAVVPLATYTSAHGVTFKRSRDSLIRMRKDADFVFVNDMVLNPSGNRSTLLLPNKATLELVDDTRMVILEGSGDGLNLEFPRGKLVLRLADKPLRLTLKVGARQYELAIKGDMALVGAQVTLQDPPVSDDENRRGSRSLDLYVARGELELTSGKESISVAGGHEIVVQEAIGVPQQKPTDNLPAWINGTVSVVEEKTAFKLAERIPYKDRIEISYREELSSSERGIRRLAIAGMETIGDVAGLVGGLVQPGNSDVRDASIAALRDLMWNDPAQIPKVRGELAGALSANNASIAMRYLLGFSDQAQADRRTYEDLVDGLESENQTIRQLAIYNLNELTGGKSYNFTAEGTPPTRRAAVASWRRWLEREKTLPPKRMR